MKTLKTLALAALTAATVLAPAAKAGFTHEGIKFHDATDFTGQYARIVDQLYKLEVAVVDGRNDERFCGPVREDGWMTLGWYTPEDDFVVLCDGNHALRAETLTHEATHVLQDCRDGLANDTMQGPSEGQLKLIGEHLDEEKAQNIVENYDKADWKFEAEAFLLEDKPEVVSDLIEGVCFKF